MIEIRTVCDELDRLDEIHRQQFCADCSDVPDARCSGLRLAFESAAARGDTRFMVCANCSTRWMPGPNINYAVRDWRIVTSDVRLAAVLCAECAASHPDPMRVPAIARSVLERSRGPIQ
jgi:hypothetical protein